MSATGSLLLLAVAAPPSLADVPPLDRARPHFYAAVADRGPVTVAWSAEPDGGDIALTLTVRGAANPTEVKKPDVRSLLAGRFQVLDRSDPPSTPAAVRFGYTLRPVSGGIAEVPGLPFAYYRPGYPEGRRMLTAYADPLPLPASAPLPTPVGSLPEVPPAGVTVPGWAWLLPVGLVLPLVLVGTPLARRWFPDAARRAELRRVKAVREALDALATAGRGHDPAGATAMAVRRYLDVRPPADSEPFAALLDRCDAVRFGSPGGDNGLSLPAAALALIEASGRREPVRKTLTRPDRLSPAARP